MKTSALSVLAAAFVFCWTLTAQAQQAPSAPPPAEQPAPPPAEQPAPPPAEQPAAPPAPSAEAAPQEKPAAEEQKPVEEKKEEAQPVQPEAPAAPEPAQPPAPETAKEPEQPAEEPKAEEQPPAEPVELAPPEEKEEEAEKVPFGVSRAAAMDEAGVEGRPYGAKVILDNSLGIGTFVKNEYARNASFAQLVSMRSYFKYMGWTTQLRYDIAYEYTDVDAADGRQYTLYDVMLSFIKSDIVTCPYTGIVAGGMLRFLFPTSYESWYDTRYLTVVLNPMLSRSFLDGKLTLDYSFRFAKYLNRYTSKVVDPSDTQDYPLAYGRGGGAENVAGGLAIGGSGRSYYFMNEGTVTWTFTDTWSVFIDLMIFNYFKYPVDVDDYSVEFAKSRGQDDFTWGTIAVDWNVTKDLMIEFGVTSLQPAKNPDNKTFRLPWFDFVSDAGNVTSWYLDFIYSF